MWQNFGLTRIAMMVRFPHCQKVFVIKLDFALRPICRTGTRSPDLTSSGTSLRLRRRMPENDAMIFASCGYSLAVSG